MVVMFILCPNAVTKELYKELYKWVLPTEGKRRGLQYLHQKQTFNKIKMSPVQFIQFKSINYLIKLQFWMSDLRI